jgi:hypothetical protein
MMEKLIRCSLYFALAMISSLNAQNIITPDINAVINGSAWKNKFVSVELVKKDTMDALMITKTDADDLVWLDGFNFTNGIIEFDAKGKSGPPQSNFIGIAFRVVNENTYDAIYFRPFNFRSPNPVNKSHAVQYISHPDWTWKRLRDERSGEYEKGIEPPPNGDEWFHAKIEVNKPEIKVYVNGANDPSLVVNELSERKDGSVGLWCNGFGIIANLRIEPK